MSLPLHLSAEGARTLFVPGVYITLGRGQKKKVAVELRQALGLELT